MNGPWLAVARRNLPQRPSPLRARLDQGLSLHARIAHWISLPSPADLLRIRRRGARSLWPLGRRLDDVGEADALSPIRHVGARFRARSVAGKIALVYAVALRTMARHKCWPLLGKIGFVLANPPLVDRILAVPHWVSEVSEKFSSSSGGASEAALALPDPHHSRR